MKWEQVPGTVMASSSPLGGRESVKGSWDPPTTFLHWQRQGFPLDTLQEGLTALCLPQLSFVFHEFSPQNPQLGKLPGTLKR